MFLLSPLRQVSTWAFHVRFSRLAGLAGWVTVPPSDPGQTEVMMTPEMQSTLSLSLSLSLYHTSLSGHFRLGTGTTGGHFQTWTTFLYPSSIMVPVWCIGGHSGFTFTYIIIIQIHNEGMTLVAQAPGSILVMANWKKSWHYQHTPPTQAPLCLPTLSVTSSGRNSQLSRIKFRIN